MKVVAGGVVAGIAAGIVSTLAQTALWLVFTDALPAILFRDARLAAAIALGPDALLRPDDDLLVLVVATIVHFALSIVYGVAIAIVVDRLRLAASLAVGAVGGAALFVVNLYGFTGIWPWFTAARDAITFAAHVVFGVAAAWVYRYRADRARFSARTPSA